MEKQEFKEARVVCLTHRIKYDYVVTFLCSMCELLIFDLKEQPSEECHTYHR